MMIRITIVTKRRIYSERRLECAVQRSPKSAYSKGKEDVRENGGEISNLREILEAVHRTRDEKRKLRKCRKAVQALSRLRYSAQERLLLTEVQ